MANFVLPYDPNDVTHLDADKRRRETRDWLRRRQRELTVDAPPIVPDPTRERPKLVIAPTKRG
jgi:hypothetical protein